MNLTAILEIARSHIGSGNMQSSAKTCLHDAVKLATRDELTAAKRALRSIAYSVGILHPDYKKAFELSGIPGEIRLF